MSKYVPNSFQVPNAIVDELLVQMSPTATKCYLLIVRKTLGWGKDEDKISLSQFEKYTGAKKSAVGNAVKWLEQMDLIKRDFRDGLTTNYIINKSPALPSERKGAEPDPSIETGPPSHLNGTPLPSERMDPPIQTGQQNTLITKPTSTKPTLLESAREDLQSKLHLPDNHLRELIPEQAQADFESLKTEYRNCGGEIKNIKRCEMVYWRRIWIPDKQAEFLQSLQNMMNLRRKQGTSVPNLASYIESGDWVGNDDHLVPGPIHLDGAPEPVAEATDDEKRKAEVRAARIERRNKLREEGII